MATIFEYGKRLLALCRNNQHSSAVWLFENKITKRFSEQQIFQSFLVMWKVPEAYCNTNQWEKGVGLALHYLTPLRMLNINVDYVYKSFAFLIYKALWPSPPLINPKTIDPSRMYSLLKTLKNAPSSHDIDKKLYIQWIKLIPTIENFNFNTGQLFYQLYQPHELAGSNGGSKSDQKFSWLDIWYLKYTKFLYIGKQYELCSTICERAIETSPELSDASRIWITRYYALALRQLGDVNRAITHMEVLTKRKPEWFIYRELAEMYLQKGDTADGKKWLVMAYRLGGHNPSKVNLYEQLGNFYNDQGIPALARQLYLLAVGVRQEQHWSIPESLKAKASGNEPTGSSKPALLYCSILKLLQLTTEVNGMLYGEGKITRILHPGPNGDGFITDTEGNTVYFRFVQTNIKANEVAVGDKVKFKARPTVHRGQERFRAIKVYGTW